MSVQRKSLEGLPPSETSSIGAGNVTWDQGAEIRARTKADCSVVPLLFLGLIVFQLDRMNLGSALTGGFGGAIGIDQSTVNLGNQMMFLDIVVLEIPSNLLFQRVFIFETIATVQVFLVNRNEFLVSRAILGLADAEYIPGAIYTLSTWFFKRELAKRVALLFFGMFGGNAISPLLGAGLLKLDGNRGLAGWQWIFVIEGIFTIFVFIMVLFFLPGSSDEPRPLLSKDLIRFTEDEQIALRRRLEVDDVEKKGGSQGICMASNTNIKRSLGFEKFEANALCAIGGFMSLEVVFFFAWLSDSTGRHGLAVMSAIFCYLIVLVAKTVHSHVEKWSRFEL